MWTRQELLQFTAILARMYDRPYTQTLNTLAAAVQPFVHELLEYIVECELTEDELMREYRDWRGVSRYEYCAGRPAQYPVIRPGIRAATTRTNYAKLRT